MEPSESSSSSGGRLSQAQTRTGLKGPRPFQLKVSQDSHKIKKPPVVPQQQQPLQTAVENRQPVVIFAVSPKVMHTTVSGFMELVQRHTGSSSSSSVDPASTAATTTSGDISPAARLASIEKASPSRRERDRETAPVDVLEITEGVEVCQIPGILSPSPANLPFISPWIFSPTSDPQNCVQWPDLMSPFHLMHGNTFLPSPSTLFADHSSSVYPSPPSSCFEPFNPFFDF